MIQSTNIKTFVIGNESSLRTIRIVVATDIEHWGVIMLFGDKKKEIIGSIRNAESYQLHLQAVTDSLYLLNEPCKVVLVTNSPFLDIFFKKQLYKEWPTIEKVSTHKGKRPIYEMVLRDKNNKQIQFQELWKTLMKYQLFHSIEHIFPQSEAEIQLHSECLSLIKK